MSTEEGSTRRLPLSEQGMIDSTLLLRQPTQSPFATICVLGAARGGTSMVAGILRLMGVHMGYDIDPANNEDRAFLGHQGGAAAFMSGNEFHAGVYVGGLIAQVEKRNAEHQRWGWKDPLAAFYVPKLHGYLREPHYIFVTRDPFNVARGERRNMGESVDMIGQMKHTCAIYDRCLNIVANFGAPALLVSYERTIRRPRATLEAIADFIGVSLNPHSVDDLALYIEPDRRDANIEGIASALS